MQVTLEREGAVFLELLHHDGDVALLHCQRAPVVDQQNLATGRRHRKQANGDADQHRQSRKTRKNGNNWDEDKRNRQRTGSYTAQDLIFHHHDSDT